MRDHHSAVPITPEEIAREAVAALAAGAAELHVHPRDDQGAETLAPEPVAACLSAVRQAVPGMPVGIGTGAWIAPGGRERHPLMRAWGLCPDYCSVNLNEEDAPEVMALLHHRGIGIEAGLWSVADARRFVALPMAPHCLRILIEMPPTGPVEARDSYRQVRAILDGAGVTRPVLLHGEDESAWAMVDQAAADGLDTRIGLEDVLTLPDGRTAPDTAALVAAAVAKQAPAAGTHGS